MYKLISIIIVIMFSFNYSNSMSLEEAYKVDPRFMKEVIREMGLNEYNKFLVQKLMKKIKDNDGIIQIDEYTAIISGHSRKEYLIINYTIDMGILVNMLLKLENPALTAEEEKVTRDVFLNEAQQVFEDIKHHFKTNYAIHFCGVPAFKAIFEEGGKLKLIYNANHNSVYMGFFVLDINSCNELNK